MGRHNGPSAQVNAHMDTERRTWEERGLRQAVLSGDERAWRTLYDRCFTGLYRYAYRQTGQQHQRAEEVVQDCWMVAVRRIRSFDPERGSFAAWLRGIADKTIQNKQRRWQRRDRTELQLEQPPAAKGPWPAVALADQIAAVLTALPEHYQDVLRAKYHEGRSVADIASEGHHSAKAVESLLTRARAAFKKEYRRLNQEG